jgi:hypothetical protein
MISHRANLFESLNKQIKVNIGEDWIEIINPSSFISLGIHESLAVKSVPFLVGYKDLREVNSVVTLMSNQGIHGNWSNHQIDIEGFLKIPFSSYKKINPPIKYAFKINEEVIYKTKKQKTKIISHVTGAHGWGNPEYLLDIQNIGGPQDEERIERVK